jgi:phospholipid N-methyltransferase
MLSLQRLRPQPDKRLAFLHGFLQRPQLVGSVIPSSRFLERRIVELSAIDAAHTVVELGPGTGGTTRAILRALPRDSRLCAIEISPQFVSLLRSNSDPRLTVYHGSAEHIQKALDHHGLSNPDVVLSGIPFSTMSFALGQRIIRSVWSSLAPGGQFVAYQFRDRVSVLGREILGAPKVEVELRNVPPMRVYCWRKPQEEHS